MRIEGRWLRFPDGVERPVIDAHLLLPTRQLIAVPFLLDTGADMTIVSYDVARSLAAFLQQSSTIRHDCASCRGRSACRPTSPPRRKPSRFDGAVDDHRRGQPRGDCPYTRRIAARC